MPTTSPTLYEIRTSAYGLPVHLAAVGADPAALEDARVRLAGLGRAWDADLPRLAARSGSVLDVEPETVLLVSLVRGGDVVTDRRHGRAGIDAGVLPDLLALRGALAADLLVHELTRRGAEGACVDVGGDVHVSGASPRPGGWRLSAASPRGSLFGAVTLAGGALAGAHGGGGGIRSAFVTGAYAYAAKLLALDALRLTRRDAEDRVRATGGSGLLVGRGAVWTVGPWGELAA